MLVTTNHLGTPVTSSLAVAEGFGKRHEQVLRDIRAVLDNYATIVASEDSCVNPDFDLPAQFIETSYTTPGGAKHPAYDITWYGFQFVGLGYGGEDALEAKLLFAGEFHRVRQNQLAQLKYL